MKKPLLLCSLAAFALCLPFCSHGQISLSFDADNEICGNANGRAWVQALGGNTPYTYLWSNGAQTDTINNLSAGYYTVTVNDQSGSKSIDSVEVKNDVFNIQLNTNLNKPSCSANNGSINVSAFAGTSPYSYSWTGGNSGPDLNNIPAGVYSLTITDANNCKLEKNIHLSNINAPTVSISSNAVSCFGNNDGSAVSNVTGGAPPYNYLWNNNLTAKDLINANAGDYYLIVTDDNNCKGIVEVVVSEPSKLLVDVFPLQAACGGFGGKAGVAASGGTPPYMYNWPNGDTTASIGGLVAGLYMCSVTDANGCQNYDITNINTTPPPSSVIFSTSESCSGMSDGKLDLSTSAGKPPFTYEWSNGAKTQDIETLREGEYTVTLTDANGCSNTNTVIVGNDKPILIEFEVTPVSAVDAADGKILTIIQGVTLPITYQWSNGVTTPDNENLGLGTYTITVTDVLGCNKDQSTGVFLVGIDDPDRKDFNIYPNPVTDYLKIQTDRSGEFEVFIFDISGKLILHEAKFTTAGELLLNTNSIEEGYYFIHLLALDGQDEYILKPFARINKD